MKQIEKNKINNYLKGIIENLPEKPGCYQYLDENDIIIYVGKAKKLKRRVSSYFNKEQFGKTKVLVSKIRDLKYVIVNSEQDALLLENNLIKRYKPRYNVLLKDDKAYPSICVTNEPFPRIFSTRNINVKLGQYFGPYSYIPMMHAFLDICKKLYKPRTCRLILNQKDIANNKFKACLEYHIKNCDAPCIGKQSFEDYQKNIRDCIEILNGNTRDISEKLIKEMNKLAKGLHFEEANEIKKKYLLMEKFKAKSEVVSYIYNNIDVYNIENEKNTCYINYLHISNGCINQAFTFEYKKRLEETKEELLSMGILEMRERYRSTAKEIIIPFELESPFEDITLTVPQRGEKKKLLELSKLNVKQYKFDRLKQAEKLNPEQKSVRLMKEIQDSLGLKTLPYQIELFDNSNIAGSDAVAGCVVFKKLKPYKKDYRTYNIKTVEGADDYASMKEVVKRHYNRYLEEKKTLPNLIITDGGKGQMEVVRQIVEDELHLDIPIAGLAKDNKHRTNELLFGFPPKTIGLKQESQLFRLLTNMQDEVHRFAIKFHKNKRSKRQIKSSLDKISGIGTVTKKLLLTKFGSVKRITMANEDQLKEILGQKRGQKIYECLHEKDRTIEQYDN